MSAVSYSGRAYSKIWGYPLESLRNLFPFKNYYHFRFLLPVLWPTFEFPMSADVGQCRQCHIRVGRDKNVGVAVGIALPSVSVQTLFPLPVPWPTF